MMEEVTGKTIVALWPSRLGKRKLKIVNMGKAAAPRTSDFVKANALISIQLVI